MNLRNLRDSSTWLPTLAIAAGLLVAACLPKDSDDGRGGETGYWETGYYDWDDDDDYSYIGDIRGTAGVYIAEAGCSIIWDHAGYSSNGYDLSWEVSATVSTASSCSFGSDTYNSLQVSAGSVYFGADYWGAASYGGGSLSWATAGYVYGAGGYTYYYSGYGDYTVY